MINVRKKNEEIVYINTNIDFPREMNENKMIKFIVFKFQNLQKVSN